uniref:Uncharacterized protein n=1 Tax=Avena sativa TaxID=4498 RepID=A0ACD5Y919_AVESA
MAVIIPTQKDDLTNRSRTFAEAVATMVWLVILAAAVKGKSKVDVPRNMLILSASTIITGFGPLLTSCISKSKSAISDVTALLSAAMLFSLAYWVATFTVSEEYILIPVAALSLCCTVIRIISYCVQIKEYGYPERTKDFYTINDGSHEFLCCMTGIHFLWLESLALEGLISETHGIQQALSETMGTVNILSCAGGLFIIHIGMTPAITSTEMDHIQGPIIGNDSLMIITIGIVLGVAMWELFVLQGLLLLIIGTLIVVFVGVMHSKEAAGGTQNTEPPKLAPLGLTKLMVTGFVIVSISVDSTNQLIKWFLVFAAAAILSGLVWRLLTQAQVWKTLEIKENKQVSPKAIKNLALVSFSAKTAYASAPTSSSQLLPAYLCLRYLM